MSEQRKEKSEGRENSPYINSVNLNAGTSFPYLVMEIVNNQSYPRNPGFLVMHWHEDLQFILVLEGENVRVRTLQEVVTLHPGEGIFINKNVVHRVEHEGICHYYSFVFPDTFLKFYAGSPAAEVVERITGSTRLRVYPLTQEGPCSGALAQLQALADLERDRPGDYAYEVLVRLSAIWLMLSRHLPRTAPAAADVQSRRMQVFLRCIEEHYAQDLSLEQLASSAHVSRSECTRCFKKVLQTTPYRYLMEYRLSRASALLLTTDRPVSAIALDVGFHQTSHFGKCFKEKTGCSPREYRNKKTPAGQSLQLQRSAPDRREKSEGEVS